MGSSSTPKKRVKWRAAKRKKHFQFLDALTLTMNTFVSSRLVLSCLSRSTFDHKLSAVRFVRKPKQYSTRFHEIPQKHTPHQSTIFILHIEPTTRARALSFTTSQVQRFNAYASRVFETVRCMHVYERCSVSLSSSCCFCLSTIAIIERASKRIAFKLSDDEQVKTTINHKISRPSSFTYIYRRNFRWCSAANDRTIRTDKFWCRTAMRSLNSEWALIYLWKINEPKWITSICRAVYMIWAAREKANYPQ